MAWRVSCLIHGAVLVLLMGCTALKPVTADLLPDPEMVEATTFVGAVADKMPLWDADAVSRYERAEIATVKADIAMARQTAAKGPFLEYVGKLRDDWDALVALDEMLKKESLT